MCIRMKSAEFVLSFMQDCVNKNSIFVSEIIKQGIADGWLNTDFPDECAEVFLHAMKSFGIDVLSDTLLNKTLNILKNMF